MLFKKPSSWWDLTKVCPSCPHAWIQLVHTRQRIWDGNINTCAVTSLPSTTCALSLLMAWDMRESYMLAIFSRYEGLQRPITHLTFIATSVSCCAWCSHHENLHGMSALFASSILLARHAESTMQNPEDCAIKEELANAEDLTLRFDPPKLCRYMVNYVGPLKVINIPGTSSPAHTSTSDMTLQMTGSCILYVCWAPMTVTCWIMLQARTCLCDIQLHTFMTPRFVMLSVLESWSSWNVTSVHLWKWDAWQLCSGVLCLPKTICICAVSSDGISVCMAGKGRGVTVTEAVKPGTLLAVGKPLGINEVSTSECCAAAQLQLLCNNDPV